MKDTPDRSDEPLPVRRSSAPPVAPRYEPGDEYHHDAAPPAAAGMKISPRLVWRAFRRHWWQALALWLLGSAGLMVLAYAKVKPTYDATAGVKVEQGDLAIFTQNGGGGMTEFAQYMETQVTLVTSPPVLGTALATHPELTNLPLLKGTPDPEAEIRQALRVGVVRGTNLIQVALTSDSPDEAAAIVNAVVDAFVKNALFTYETSKKRQIEQLVETKETQSKEVARQRRLVETLTKTIGVASINAVKDRSVTTIEAYRRLSEELTNVEIMRIAGKARLEQLRYEKVAPPPPQDDAQLAQAVADAFNNDPRVVSNQAELDREEGLRKEAERRSRNKYDPAVVRHAQRVKDLNDRRTELWTKLNPIIRRRLAVVPFDDGIERAVREAEANLTAVTTQEETLRKKLEEMRIENKAAEGEALSLEYARRDLQRAEEVYDIIEKNLNQKQFEARSPIARISKEFEAKPSRRPSSQRRAQALLAAPLATGMLVLGLLVLLELRGARVADPDELTSRVNLQVIGVVPPLPQIRAGSSNGNGNGTLALQSDLRAQRELDEFVQSLDHLRVALCARPDPWGRDRHCVLITSACGSEGKTTLAAQLAERCVNAGLMTLLIDADLRNPTLSRMLDAAENPGLINVLRGEMSAEDVVMVIGDAGGFHLLPAGAPRVDPSRLLQDSRLGQLMAQARESFDMIIVDAPPVLPVPDALTIGRWTDGAVLAVRYDTSRFPLVERANRRLAHVGVPVIGAVVNGVRSVESTYGGYYTYGYGGAHGNSANSSAPPSPSASSQSSILDEDD